MDGGRGDSLSLSDHTMSHEFKNVKSIIRFDSKFELYCWWDICNYGSTLQSLGHSITADTSSSLCGKIDAVKKDTK